MTVDLIINEILILMTGCLVWYFSESARLYLKRRAEQLNAN